MLDERSDDKKLDMCTRGVDEGAHVAVPGLGVCEVVTCVRLGGCEELVGMESETGSVMAEDLNLGFWDEEAGF